MRIEKKNLEDYVEDLKGVLFQKALGTSYEKMIRFLALSELLAQKVCPDKKNKVQRAARLCKADLVTQMVYEFPELQGIMGGYYAAHSGEDPEVVQAIKEHYRPSFSGDSHLMQQHRVIVNHPAHLAGQSFDLIQNAFFSFLRPHN